ncbi:hypothetical protein A3K86_16450 [Photobacterium jeanii]|uniref:BMC domain-containing protein n=1 Tax=Photobacterium jeanii TaxID=858640 RepID=A0A178K861_9GAMM|nr:BMC domain-containing protein [Photobacterium jeanii]OAN13246.1 hypothetical protein A3K86_16450 [Photobacterium jeanii]PST89397.1 BMC domain-containing protein [Photobacterium jeanii]
MTISLGVIETVGLTSAIHAADAACKAAGVHLTGYRKAGSGLVSVYFEGEISAVNAAVECGLDAIRDQVTECMSLVMARPDSSVLAMLAHGPLVQVESKALQSQPVQETPSEQQTSTEEEVTPESVIAKEGNTTTIAANTTSEPQGEQPSEQTVPPAMEQQTAASADTSATQEPTEVSADKASTRKSATSRRKRTSGKSQGSKK